MAATMKEILKRLHRDGFSSADSCRYVGTNPHEIRKTLLASAETDDFIFAMDAFAFSIVSNLFGTKIASTGFTDRKKNKFKTEAVNLVACAKECWAALERNKQEGMQISKNSVPASVP